MKGKVVVILSNSHCNSEQLPCAKLLLQPVPNCTLDTAEHSPGCQTSPSASAAPLSLAKLWVSPVQGATAPMAEPLPCGHTQSSCQWDFHSHSHPAAMAARSKTSLPQGIPHYGLARPSGRSQVILELQKICHKNPSRSWCPLCSRMCLSSYCFTVLTAP